MSGCPFHKLRSDLPAGMPSSMAHLPRDERGYPVPFFVDWLDGKPEFRAMDGRKFDRCMREKLCWVCGGRLKRHFAFVIGPMCTISRTTGEPPSHLDCAAWSVKACPFLTKPQMKRREDDVINNDTLKDRSSGIPISRNPGVTALWVTTSYKIFPDDVGRPLIEVGDPKGSLFSGPAVTWWREGRPATRAECVVSIESGLPLLYAADPGNQEAVVEINERYRTIEKLLPRP